MRKACNNALAIQRVPLAPIDLPEIGAYGLGRQQIRVLAGHARHVSGKLRNLARWLVLSRAENANDAFLDRPHALAVASTRRLSDLVEPRLRAPDAGKVEIDPGLDERRGDQAARFSLREPLPNVAENS